MNKVVADSSFYICFLDDIKKPEYLIRLVDHFEFVLGKIIHKEIRKSPNYSGRKNIMKKKVLYFEYENYGEILRPFFSMEEIQKGEHEAIAISIILIRIELLDISLIMDDSNARNFIKKNFQDIYHMVKYTVQFIVECYDTHRIFKKEEIVEILTLIKKSKFRIDKKLVDYLLKNLKRGDRE